MICAGDIDRPCRGHGERKAAEDVTTVPKQSISVFENRKPQDVTGWVPLRGARSGLQLVVLLDDSSRGNLGLQLNDIRSFLTGLPPTTQVAIGYMRNGTPNLVQNFTNDHAQAAKALRLPRGRRESTEALISASRTWSSIGRAATAMFAAR